MTKLVFLDTETTGLDPFRHELLEVAMIVRSDEFKDHEVHFSLNIDPARAEPKALEVNRYNERRAELAALQISDARAGARFQNWLTDSVVIGNNPQFDLRFIEQFLRTRTMAGTWAKPAALWHYHPIDLKALVAGTWGLGQPPWRTPDIAGAAGVPLPQDAHTALADARWNRDVYDAVYADRPSLSEVVRVARGGDAPITVRGYA